MCIHVRGLQATESVIMIMHLFGFETTVTISTYKLGFHI